jgi:hypothetical protein
MTDIPDNGKVMPNSYTKAGKTARGTVVTKMPVYPRLTSAPGAMTAALIWIITAPRSHAPLPRSARSRAPFRRS